MPARAQTTLVLKKEELNLCRRGDSGNWQCHFKIAGQWYRKSTGETDQTEATQKAWEFFYGGRQKNSEGLPIMNKSFKDFAQLAIERMERANKAGTGKSVYKEHIGTIKNYLIPALGQRAIKAIDGAALEHLDRKRQEIMGKVPAKSTIQSHNAALKRVLDEAINRGHMNESDRPKLPVKGANSKRRPDFSAEEIAKMLPALDRWAQGGRNVKLSKYRRLLLKDLVEIILETGVRPGEEILNLKWHEITVNTEPGETVRYWSDEKNDYVITQAQKTVITFKVAQWKDKRTDDTRMVLGDDAVIEVFLRIARRNYPDKWKRPLILKKVLEDPEINSDFVFRIPGEQNPITDLEKVWKRFISFIGMRICPRTNEPRTLYSLRHTYVTLMLIHETVPLHTLSRQLGTSIEMIEQHYSHLTPYLARHQLGGEGVKHRIASLSPIDIGRNIIDPSELPDDEM